MVQSPWGDYSRWEPRKDKSRWEFNSPVLADGWEVAMPQATDSTLAKAHLKDLFPLRTINLSSTKVTDAGLANLEGLYELRALDLSGAKITDAGLEHLKRHRVQNGDPLVGYHGYRRWVGAPQEVGCPGMADLRNTNVTEEGAKILQRALPKCEIEHWIDPRRKKRTATEDGIIAAKDG